jgi:CHAT domain-containing protein
MDNWQTPALSEYEHIGVSTALARVLLPPAVRRSLSAQGVTHLLIVPTHWLALTPFSTLVLDTDGDGDQLTFKECRFLLRDYSISFIQSLGVLNALRRRRRERNEDGACQLLAFGDPVHYDSDPRANKVPADYRSDITAGEEIAEAVRLNVLRSFHIISGEHGEEVWSRLTETAPEVLSVARTFKDHVTFEEPLAELPPCTTEAVVCLGHAANRDLALSQAVGRFSNILFSVHGHADLANPWLSFLMLTDRRASPGSRQPTPLTMSDVFDMTLNADTVVLAACETALGRVRPGEGVVGFPLAFLFAGARTVLLTQWQIPSAYQVGPGAKEVYPSSTIVTGFYHNWLHEGMSFAEALRQAQILLYNEHDDFKDPFFWGAWQLYGEWLSQSEFNARAFPSDLRAETRYADVLQEQGSLSVMNDDFAGGLQAFAQATEILEGILSRDHQSLGMIRSWAAVLARVTWLTAGHSSDGSMVESLALFERLARTDTRQLLDQRRLGGLWFLVGASSYWNGELEVARLFCSAAFSYLDLVDRAFPNMPEVLLDWLAVVGRLQAICFEQQDGEKGRRFVALWSEIARKTNASLVSAGIKPDSVDEVLSRLDDLVRQTEASKAVIITTQLEVLDRLSATAKNKFLVREYAFLCQLEAATQELNAGNAALKRALDSLQKLYDEDKSDLLSASALMHCLFQAGLRDIQTGHYLRAMNCYLRMKMISVDVKSHGMQLDPGTEKMVDALILRVPRARRCVCALALMITAGQAGRKRI